jgi:D-alanine-D-alanine ligase
MRVAVLWNHDPGLAHGEAIDRLAVEGVRCAAADVLEACRRLGWTAVEVEAPHPAAVLQGLRRASCDVVFHLVESVGGEARLEAASAALLEWVGTPYTGSGPLSLGLALDKPLARARNDHRR